MRRIVVNSLLLVVVVGLLSLNLVLRADATQRNFEFLPNMVTSVAYDAYSENPNFANGQTLQKPVAGTVIRGMMPVRDPRNPYTLADKQAVARGAVVFATHCEICHGPHGKGDGTVAQRGFPTPLSLLAPNAMGLTDEQIFKIITEGQKNMPPYAAQISREDRWTAVLHVRTLQGKKP
jgi:mono/diheme cytochrome c family protein